MPVFQDFCDDLMIRRKLFQNVGRGGNGFPLAVARRSGQFQILEQYFAQLLRRADVERLAGDAVDLLGEPPDGGVHEDGQAAELDRVDANAVRFHAGQHTGQRQIDAFVKLAQAARIDLRTEFFLQFESDVGLLLQRRAKLQIEAALR